MTTPDPRTQTAVTHQHCPLLALRRTNPGFDWPCECGRPGSQCTKKEDGTCG